MVTGQRWSVTSADAVRIGVISDGVGDPLLLVHGGMGQIERWSPVWSELRGRWAVTAMDRRGRGSSGDADGYRIEFEYADVTAVTAALAAGAGQPVDVFAHSIGATIALGAAAQDAPIRRLVCYDPPGPATVPAGWLAHLRALLGRGQVGAAMASFLQDVVGLTAHEVDRLRQTPPSYDVLAVAARTAEREAVALHHLDVAALARTVRCPTTLLLGEHSPAWAASTAGLLTATATTITARELPGVGHEAIDRNPNILLTALHAVLG